MNPRACLFLAAFAWMLAPFCGPPIDPEPAPEIIAPALHLEMMK
jgi:hypothetical protein